MQKMVYLTRRLDARAPLSIGAIHFKNLGGGVHMTLNKMSTHQRVRAHGSFHIHHVANAHFTNGGVLQCLRNHIE